MAESYHQSFLRSQGVEFEIVKAKHLGIVIGQNLTFQSHIENLVGKLKLKLGFFFRNILFLHSGKEMLDLDYVLLLLVIIIIIVIGLKALCAI